VETSGTDFELRAYERLAELFARLLAEERLDSLLRALADAVEELIPCSGLVLFELDETEEMLEPLVVRGSLETYTTGLSMRVGEGLAGLAVASREPVLSNDTRRDSRGAHVPGTPEEDVEAIAAVPLVARGRATGCLSIYREGEGNVFGEDEFRFATRFANAAALALDNARVRARLERLAQTDDLTGILNRRGFFEAAGREIARAQRDRKETALLVIDVDELKAINDGFGHGCGDQVLRQVAQAIVGRTRRADIVGRLGGDEFAVVLPGASAENAERLALQLESLIDAAHVEMGEVTVPVSASVGVAATDGDPAVDVASLLTQADADMYRRKSVRDAADAPEEARPAAAGRRSIVPRLGH